MSERYWVNGAGPFALTDAQRQMDKIMTDELAPSHAEIEKALIRGDLSGLSEAQRLSHYKNVCESLGLNPLTQPFDYLKLNGKLVLYAKRDAAEQLRKIHGVSITDIKTEHFNDIYIVTAKAMDKTGRSDASTGVVPLGALKDEALSNALMKAETKAKRRVTLSICGLGLLDETEIDSIQGAKPQGYTVTAPPLLASTPVEAGSYEQSIAASLAIEDDVRHEELDHNADLPDGSVLIEKVEAVPTRNANVRKFKLITNGGEEVATFNERYAALAEQVCQDRTPVRLVTKPTKYGLDLVSIHAVTGELTLAEKPPITADDIAF